MSDDKRISFLDQLEACKKEKSIVEIFTEAREVKGVINTIGTDYIGVITSIERTVQAVSQGQDGVKETDEHIIVYELEVFLKFADIRAVSKVLKFVPK